jgi:hypothetical protein
VTSVAGGGGQPVRGVVGTTSRTGIDCAVCAHPIPLADWPDAFCWVDPGGHTCAAHGFCLRALGERDLDLGRPVR